MKLNKKIVEELQFILNEAETKIGSKIEKTLLDMYWHIGYCLRVYSDDEISNICSELSVLLSIEKELLLSAYCFYKEHPIKKNFRRIGG